MKRFNGWGDVRTVAHLSDNSQRMLTELVGPSKPGVSVPLETQLAQVPASALPESPLFDRSAETRLRHARGQSLPDWVALRYGRVARVPDAVAFPQSNHDLQKLLDYAKETGVRIVPYGGGTSVVGHLTPPAGPAPVLTVSMSHLNRMLALQEENHLATFEAGITGPDLEAALRACGYTLGHYPQSFEYSTLGGWVVTRSAGQQSLGFGRIEDQFAGGKMLTPMGELVMPNLPASAAGPDLRQLVLGSEGRMGFLAEATVRIHKLPESETFHACFFPSWEQGLAAVRELSQSQVPLSMMRLSNAAETRTNLVLAGREQTIGYLKKYLRLRGVGENGVMLLLGFSTAKAFTSSAKAAALSICKHYKGVHLHQPLGRAWSKNRFRAPYLRNTLWEQGYAVDTLETCLPWSGVHGAVERIEASLRASVADEGEQIHTFTHLSHFYPSGCSIYTTYLFRLDPDPEVTLTRWTKLKRAVSEAVVGEGGTISHQHGVGEDHAPYLIREKGSLGLSTLRQVFNHFDPQGIMNPGKLVTAEASP